MSFSKIDFEVVGKLPPGHVELTSI